MYRPSLGLIIEAEYNIAPPMISAAHTNEVEKLAELSIIIPFFLVKFLSNAINGFSLDLSFVFDTHLISYHHVKWAEYQGFSTNVAFNKIV